jgi:hypothetical protein
MQEVWGAGILVGLANVLVKGVKKGDVQKSLVN